MRRVGRIGVLCVSVALGACAHAPLPPSADPPVAAPSVHSWDDPAVIATWQVLGGTGARPGPVISPVDAFAAALNFNSRMALARAQAEVGRAGILVARQRVNPTLSLTPERVLGALGGASPWVAAISLAWPVQSAEKRSLAIEQALASSDASLLTAANDIWMLRTSVRAAVCTAELADIKGMLGSLELGLREELVARLEKQVAAGVVARPEAARAQLERDNAAKRLRQSEAELHSAWQDLAAATGLPLAQLQKRTLGDTCLASQPLAASAAVAQVVDKAVATRLDLRARLAEFHAADTVWRSELARRKPDLTLGPGYTYDQGDHKISFAVSGELPVYARNDAAIAHADAERNRIRAEIEVLQQAILNSVAQARDQLRAAEAQRAAASGLANRAQELLNRDIARQAAGELDQTAVLTSRIAFVTARIEILTARRMVSDALASLESAAQAPLASPFFDAPAAQSMLAVPGTDSKEVRK